jgi:hypothetical protein
VCILELSGGGAVVATDTASVDAGYDNGAGLHGTPRPRRCDGSAAPLINARSVMRRRKVSTERRRWAERAARQRFHDLRQTCATLLLTKGVHPKIVSEMLGHSSVSITPDVYSHVIPVLGEGAASAREEALGNYYPSQPNLNAYQASITVEG